MTKTLKAKPKPAREHRAGRNQSGWQARLAKVGMCLYWPGIFVISHIPKRYVPRDVTVSGIGVHIAAYFVLTLLVFISAGLAGRSSFRSKKTWGLIGIIAAYAAVDEWLQVYIEGRHGSPVDWAIDVAACVLCVVVLGILGKYRSGRGKQLAKQG